MPPLDPQRLQTYRDLMDSLDPSGSPKAVYVSEPTPKDPARPDRCLVLDAAFNPPTVAHWELALKGARVSEADRILLQVSIANVDKSVSGADLGLRVYMVDRLAADHDHIGVSACSHARFVDKAEALHNLAPSTRHIFAAAVRSSGEIVTFDVKANAFLPHQVRRMAGSLVDIGRGNLSLEDFRLMIDGGRSEAGARSLGPEGLCLINVTYADFPRKKGESDGNQH